MYASQVALSIYYLRRFLMTRWLRYWILASLVIDGACSIVVLVDTYECLVDNPGSYEALRWTLPIIFLFTYASASITQAFFCYRYWTISRNKWITGFIAFIIPVNMLFSLSFVIKLLLRPKEMTIGLPLMILVICAVTDITIAVSLVWTCWRIESPYATTRNLLRRVMVQSLACGFTTVIFTILMTIFLPTVYNGRIYSLSVLLNLILFKVMHRNDPSTMRIDSIFFKNTSDTETSDTQLPSENSRHYPTHLQFTTLANDQPSIHTV
ncbi:hypothetical protein DFS33DRAFT_1089265 [Desarmillaria ectypa]|nr:hypothetical protein DFS33DRAFT_1089265 [Desarmillaria ectypa]